MKFSRIISGKLMGAGVASAFALVFLMGSGRPPTSEARALADGRDVVRSVKTPGRSVAGDPTCVDNDGDGYGVPGDASCANGAATDCNDGDADVNPGATELCNGVDDNCVDGVDEGFLLLNGAPTEPDAFCVGGGSDGAACTEAEDCPDGACVFETFADLSIGAGCINGRGICARAGTVVCSGDGTEAICDAVPGDPDPGGEGLDGDGLVDATVESCFDRLDNDCDGLVDHGGLDEGNVRQDTNCTSTELCDGFDNDNDGAVDEDFDLGSPCAVGIGNCVNSGVTICGTDGTMICNVSPLFPGVESPPGSPRCADGADNDCDGLADLADDDCQTPEKCDGADNDGDGQIDEDFTDLGQLCTTGVGACEASGGYVCSPDGTGVLCTAVGLPPSPERPFAFGTCEDGIDNDCDGFTDGDDVSCGASDLRVSCALPYLRGKPGNDCTGWHVIEYEHNGGESAVVTAEVLALQTDGSLIELLPVADGEEIHLASRLGEDDFKMWSKNQGPHGRRHQVFAPVPVLRVTVQNAASKAQAFCSNIPFLHVVAPNNTVLATDEAVLPVLIMIPRVNPGSLSILLDGVDLVAGLGLDPTADFPGGPYAGTVDVNGEMVLIEDLVVDVGAIDELSSNSIRMNIVGGLGCGGHVILVDGEWARDAFPKRPGKPATSCYADDVKDAGTAMVFRIEVTKPMDGDVTTGGPTQVIGSVCHGKPITEVDVSGFDIDTAGQSMTAGDGETSADSYALDFDVMIPVTNLRAAIAAGDATGSFDPGSNRLVARAMDENFNTTFDTVTFAVGPIVPAPGFGSTIAGAGDPPNFVERAFVLGVNTTGIDKVFTAQKDSNKRCIGDRVQRKLRDQRPPAKKMSVNDACDPDVNMSINGTEIQKDGGGIELDFGVSVAPVQDQIDVRIDLPPIDLEAHFGGYCESGCVCAFGGCLCASCVTVDVDAKLVRKNMNLAFSVTEDRIMQTDVPREEREPLDFSFDVGESDPDDATKIRGEVDIGCVLGFFLDVAEFFVTVFTLGFVDLDLDTFDFEIEGDDMKDRFESLDGDPMDLDFVEMKNDEEALDDFDSKQRDSRLTGVEIAPGGLAISVGSAFEPKEDKIDPEAAPIPGTPLKDAPVPQPPISDFKGEVASDVTIAISDDVFNQLFYNMTQTGKLKTEFTHVRELRSFMPDDCDSITDDENRRARCIGWQTLDCEQFSRKTCSEESAMAGTDCTLDAQCHVCPIGTPNEGDACTLDIQCGQVCSAGSAHDGELCSLNSDCPGVCSAGSTNAGIDCTADDDCGKICSAGSSNAGASCNFDIACVGGTCVPSGTCDGAGTCDNAGVCDTTGTCDVGTLRRSCIIGKLLAQRFNIRPDTQMVLKAKIDEAPKLLIDDDPMCPPGAAIDDPCRTEPVEVKLHVSNLTIAMIADRNNNSLVDDDAETIAVCDFAELNADNILELENEPAGTISTDCLMWKHCLKIDVNFSMGVEEVNGKPRIKMDFLGVDRENTGGYQCGGGQSLPELDFFNDRAGRDDSIDALETNIRDNTPPVAPEGLDLGGNVSFEIERILAIRTRPLATCNAGTCSGGFNNGGSCSVDADCEDFYQDFIGLTGGSTGTPGPNTGCDE